MNDLEKCPVCRKENIVISDYCNVNYMTLSIFHYLKKGICTNCGFSWVLNPPSQVELLEFYESSYRIKKNMMLRKSLKFLGFFVLDIRSLCQLKLAESFVKFHRKDVLLDIGGGVGNALINFYSYLGIKNNFIIEISRSVFTNFFFKSIGTRFSKVEEFGAIGVSAKMILLSHVLEHLTVFTAKKLLIDLKQLVKNDGIILIEVPNDELREFFAEKFQEDTPHMMFFSKKSLTMFLEEAGWRVLFCETVGIRDGEQPSYKHKRRFCVNHYILFKMLQSVIMRQIKKTSPELQYHGNRSSLRLVAAVK
jgi:SAM-dependent methyltransferase